MFLFAKLTFIFLLYASSFLSVLCHSHLLLFFLSNFLLLYSFVFSKAKMSVQWELPIVWIPFTNKQKVLLNTASQPMFTILEADWSGISDQGGTCCYSKAHLIAGFAKKQLYPSCQPSSVVTSFVPMLIWPVVTWSRELTWLTTSFAKKAVSLGPL